MNFARKAVWLCGGAMALAPQVTIGNTSQTRLVIGVTVVTPCRVGIQASPSCVGPEPAPSITRDEAKLNPPTASKTNPKFAKFVEVSF